jgi:hypothetical protein
MMHLANLKGMDGHEIKPDYVIAMSARIASGPPVRNPDLPRQKILEKSNCIQVP